MEPLASVLVVDALRTPFVKAFGPFENETPLTLSARLAGELLARNGVAASQLGELVWGTVIGSLSNHNLARDIVVTSGFPCTIPACTVSKACVSSFQALRVAADAISLGRNRLAIAGGVEVMSRVPLQFTEPARRFFTALSREKTALGRLRRAVRQFRPRMLFPAPVGLTESATGLTMGDHAEIMAVRNDISRKNQDSWTVTSHARAHRATVQGHLKDEILPVVTHGAVVLEDSLIRAEASLESLAPLKPVFDRRHGTLTAANSTALTDGAAALLLASPSFVEEHNLTALGRLVASVSVGVDPADQLLIGPAYAIPILLREQGLDKNDVGVFEVHEAFAAQLLSCQKAWESPEFCARLGLATPFGSIPEERLNIDGGSLAFGHPLAATGARLVSRALRIARREGSRFAVVSACAAGGLAEALLLEVIP